VVQITYFAGQIGYKARTMPDKSSAARPGGLSLNLFNFNGIDE
jgi:hypothetical protein